MLDSGFQKASLVWSPAPDSSHVAKGNTNSSPSNGPSHSQGLAHWMSVMAEHMNSSVPHHDVHYMWNGVEAKMNQDQLSSLQKGPSNSAEDSRMDRLESGHQASSIPPSIYGAPRSNSSSSSSPPAVSSTVTSSGMLIVPQPINAIAKGSGAHNLSHSSSSNNSSGRKYQCKMCPQMFGAKADLQLHTQIHMREAKPYKCSQCSKAFANSSYLSQHTRIHLGIKPYRCEICQRKFTQLSHLQQHIRTHTGDKPYKCRHPGCTKAFSQLSNLQSHSRCHQTDKPYKCNSCYKCFADEASLLEHIPKHKESKHLKTHICQYCGKSYTQETYLAKHMQKHAERTDKRPPLSTPAHLRQEANSFWSKAGEVVSLDVLGQERITENCLQGSLDRLHIPRDHIEHTRQILGEDLRHPSSHLSQVSYDTHLATSKSSSAFTPIQTNLAMPLSSSAMASSSRPYFSYDALPFPKSSSQMGVMGDVKPPSNAFPNQLISLHQIRNYAHQPTMGGEHHFLGLKEKAVSQ